MEPSAAAAGFGHLFSWRHPATMDLSHAAYRYNQNMMEYYTCKSKSVLYFSSIDINCLGRDRTFCILGYDYGSTTISNNYFGIAIILLKQCKYYFSIPLKP